MEIAFHIGANCTDDELLLKSMLKNAESFASAGVAVPAPGNYRRLIRETIQNLNGSAPAADTRDILLDAIIEGTPPKRLVMSNHSFICIPNRIFEEGQFYIQLESKIRGFLQLFPQDDVHVYMGMRDPASFVPAGFRESKQDNFPEYLSGILLDRIRWADVVARIRQCAPQVKLTVWCNEDTPLIWPELIRALAGVDNNTRIVGGFDLLQTIMHREGLQRLLAYLKAHPPRTEGRKRDIISKFLERYAIAEALEEEIELPGWTPNVMERLSEIYDADVAAIKRMPGVNFIAP